ncbi:class I SAM-dependent methyltransferase [Candidatus Pyrohabitans sp.]
MNAREVIAEEIRRRRLIPFRDFMELALYHERYGYYSTAKERIGKGGDYFTASNVSHLFGVMLARQFEEMRHLLGGEEFTLVEMGAGTGLLARDVLSSLRCGVRYVIVERSPAMRRRQRSLLGEYDVEVVDSLRKLSGVEGCLFSNELVDAFPVHVVEVREGELHEVYVTLEEGEFKEMLVPAREELKSYFRELGVELSDGFRTEVNLEALRWLDEVAQVLRRGFLLTIDYGYPSSELYRSYRSAGTLLCYHRHRAVESPYVNVGEQDITSHVNFSALAHFGRKSKLEVAGFTDLASFLLSLGLEQEMLTIREDKGEEAYLRALLPLKRLLMPGGMGEIFKVLVQYKGLQKPKLSCFKLKVFKRWEL